ncbi:MAG: hypothetical protein V1927_01895 [Candidatus Omnitrophota bacterium]
MRNLIKILAVFAIVLFSLQVFSDNKAEVDLWGNVGFVKALPWSNDFNYVNTYSFTEPGRQWINHEWLAEYILNRIYARFGNTGLILYKILIGACVTGILCLGINSAGIFGGLGFLWLVLIISVMGYGFSTRPHLATYFLYALFLLILQRHKTAGSKTIYILPVLGILWANLHGAFFIGAVLLGIFLITEIIKRGRRAAPLALVMALFIAATFINPYGIRLWQFIFYSAGIPRPFLSEWASLLNIEFIMVHIDFVFLSLVSVFAVFFSRKPKDMTGLTVLFVTLLAAIAMRRNIPLFAVTAAFVVPGYLEDTAGGPVKKIFERIPASIAAAALILFCTVSLAYTFFFNKTDFRRIEVDQKSFPVTAVSFMKENGISGNAIIFFNWAEYCIWKLAPGCRVFLDGRLCSAYSVKTINDFFNFLYLGEDWERALSDYPADIALIHRGNPVYARMLSEPGWANVYNDRIAGLFLKKSGHEAFLLRFKRGGIRYPQVRKYEYFP